VSQETKPQVGKRYRMRHTRKGTCNVKILAVEGEWIDVVIVSGHLKGIGAGSLAVAGDRKRVRESLVFFTELGTQVDGNLIAKDANHV